MSAPTAMTAPPPRVDPLDPPPGTALGTGRRLLLALVVALLVGAGLVLRLGLVGASEGGATGIADNADGARLFCTVGLAPATDDGRAGGHGVVVTEFRTDGPECRLPTPETSGSLVLRATATAAPLLDDAPARPDGSHRFTLTWLAAAYIALFALGAGVTAFAAAGAHRPRLRAVAAALAVVVVPSAPLLAVPWWSRFLISTFGETPGLLGTTWMGWGLLTVAVTRPADRLARGLALALIALGGVVAATAKPGFVPVGLAAVASCALVAVGTHRWRRRVPGLVAALLAVVVAAAPVTAGVAFQNAMYARVNAHNLAFTAVLPESGPAAVPALGLAPGAWERAGQHYFLDGGRSVPDWDRTVGNRPAELTAAAHTWIAGHPVVLARMVHRGLVATLRPQVPYLASTTAGARVVSGTVPVAPAPEGSQYAGVMFVYFDGLPGKWVPPTLIALALLAGALTLLPRRLRPTVVTPTAVGLARAAGVLAASGLGVVVLAVLGDGYVELTKHVWLGSYLLVVSALTLGAGGAVVGRTALRRRSG